MWQVLSDPPVKAQRRGQPQLRDGREYLVGTLWALLDGERRGRLTFEVHEHLGMVQLGKVDIYDEEFRGQGGGGALIDELERLYPPNVWWLAADERDLHSPEGVALMRSRRNVGRSWIHTTSCESRLSSNCSCEFPDRPGSGQSSE